MHFRQLSSSWYWYFYAASGILHYCGQTAGWMKTPLGTEVDIGTGHIVLDGSPALRERGTTPPRSFRPISIVATVAILSYCWALVQTVVQKRLRSTILSHIINVQLQSLMVLVGKSKSIYMYTSLIMSKPSQNRCNNRWQQLKRSPNNNSSATALLQIYHWGV